MRCVSALRQAQHRDTCMTRREVAAGSSALPKKHRGDAAHPPYVTALGSLHRVRVELVCKDRARADLVGDLMVSEQDVYAVLPVCRAHEPTELAVHIL